MPYEHLYMNITINASLTSKNDITLSLGRSIKGIYEDLTDNLVFDISEEEDKDLKEEYGDGRLWHIDMILPDPFSQSSGYLTLNVGDSHSGDITNTQLVMKSTTPIFDPIPKSVKTYPGQDVFINTEAVGSSPFDVGSINKVNSIICIIHFSMFNQT